MSEGVDSQFCNQVRQNFAVMPFNANSLIVRFNVPPRESLTHFLLMIESRLRAYFAQSDTALSDIVIGFDSVYVQFARNVKIAMAEVEIVHGLVEEVLTTAQSFALKSQFTDCFTVKACYHPSIAPDLESVAQSKNLSVREVIELHTSTIYTVVAIGFMPGFAYMGQLPEAIQIARKPTPRLQVPAGAVGLAHNQTGIYPNASPGGWQIIARTALNCFRADSPVEKACPFFVGQKVKFEAISLEQFEGENNA